MQMWPGHHVDDFEGAMEASRMAAASMFQHVPLAMSLCRVDYANHLKMQSAAALSNHHMYAPSAFEGYVLLHIEFIMLRNKLFSLRFVFTSQTKVTIEESFRRKLPLNVNSRAIQIQMN